MKDVTGKPGFSPQIDITDDDIYDAMKDIPGYLDVTPGDLKEVFRFAYRRALERISSAVKAADIMTTPVHSVRVDTPVQGVAEVMAAHAISGVPVLDQSGKVVGVISEKDFLVRMGAHDAAHVMGIIAACLKGKGCVATPIRTKHAGDIMTSPAVTVTAKATAFEIMELFTVKGINRVPVADEKHELIGIVSRADLIRAKFFGG
jgi:CBS-domain-containing membrane protein